MVFEGFSNKKNTKQQHLWEVPAYFNNSLHRVLHKFRLEKVKRTNERNGPWQETLSFCGFCGGFCDWMQVLWVWNGYFLDIKPMLCLWLWVCCLKEGRLLGCRKGTNLKSRKASEPYKDMSRSSFFMVSDTGLQYGWNPCFQLAFGPCEKAKGSDLFSTDLYLTKKCSIKDKKTLKTIPIRQWNCLGKSVCDCDPGLPPCIWLQENIGMS